MADQFPDVEGLVRTWLRTVTEVTAIVGQRVFFGIPKSATEATFPLIVVTRVGGGDDQSDAPLDDALVQLDCWGSIDTSGNGKKADLRTLVNAVRSACHDIEHPQLLGVNVVSDIWLPDPDNDRPRYALTAEVAAISS